MLKVLIHEVRISAVSVGKKFLACTEVGEIPQEYYQFEEGFIQVEPVDNSNPAATESTLKYLNMDQVEVEIGDGLDPYMPRNDVIWAVRRKPRPKPN